MFRRGRGYLAAVGLLMLGYSTGAYSNCWQSSTPYNVYNLPSTIKVDKIAPVGGLIARVENFNLTGGTWRCDQWYTANVKVDFVSGAPAYVPGFSNVRSTGIPGVGMRVWFGRRLDGDALLPASWFIKSSTSDGHFNKPYMVRVDFIRTGTEVGSGTISMNASIDAWTVSPYLRLSVLDLRANTQFINEMIYSSCEPVTAVTNVSMGEVDIGDVESGTAQEADFQIDIRCMGAKPSTPPPVKVTFSRSSGSEPGLLGIQEGAGAASGVAIALTDKDGNKVMFSPTATSTTWLRSDQTAEIYRFSGKAKYVKTGSAVTPGKANGNLTYVINYL